MKLDLKFNFQKMKITISGPITSWQLDGETMETVREFILGGSKITADGDFSHEIKRHLLLGRKAMARLRFHLDNGTELVLYRGEAKQFRMREGSTLSDEEDIFFWC